jgi:hypothetical protein
VAGALFEMFATVQLSDVTGVSKITPLAVQVPASELTVTEVGQVIFGFSMSLTVTICSQVALLPEPSVTVQVTVVLPKEKVAGALFEMFDTVQLSVVIGVPKNTPLAVQVPASELTVTAVGQLIVGSSRSFTVTICSQVALLPEPSVTVQVTVVLPKGKIAGALFEIFATVQLSDDKGVPKITPLAVHRPASATALTIDGQLMVGRV